MSVVAVGDVPAAAESPKKRQCDEEPERFGLKKNFSRLRILNTMLSNVRSPLEKRMRLEERIRLLSGAASNATGDGGNGAAVPPPSASAAAAPMLSTALPSTPLSSHPALDRAAFLARLSSFAPTLWLGFGSDERFLNVGTG